LHENSYVEKNDRWRSDDTKHDRLELQALKETWFSSATMKRLEAPTFMSTCSDVLNTLSCPALDSRNFSRCCGRS
jgi:hypothetical protein